MSEEWYWCSVCEERKHDDCGFYWDDDSDMEPECPNCGSTGEYVQA